MSLAIHGTSARQKSDEPPSSIGQAAKRHVVNEEALSRLLTLDIGELRQQWRGVYNTRAGIHQAITARILYHYAAAHSRAKAYRADLSRHYPEPPSILDISERYEETSRGMDTGVGVHRLVRAGFLDLLSTIRPTR